MLPNWKDVTGVWDRMKKTKKSIALYGMGNGAQMILNVCQQKQIPVAEIFASDEFVRGHSFAGYKVKRLSELEEIYDDLFIVVAFGVHHPQMLLRLQQLSQRYEVVAPDVPVAGEGLFTPEFAAAHEEEIQQVYEMLMDDQSKRVFENVLRFKATGDIQLLAEVETPVKEIYQNLLCLGRDEIYVDLGAYDGDTLREFLNWAPEYKKIYAVEPDEKNYRKLCKTIESLGINHIEAVHAGIWNQAGEISFLGKAGRNSRVGRGGNIISAISVDSLLQGNPATYIKLDVEGSEEKALTGAQDTIRTYGPKLLLSAYHRNEDLWSLPLAVKRINPNYVFYLRHQPYIPAWETNYIGVVPNF